MTYEEKKACVEAWKAGMEEVNRVTWEEARNRSIEERFRLHETFFARLQRIGRVPAPPEDEKFYVQWNLVRKDLDERQTAV